MARKTVPISRKPGAARPSATETAPQSGPPRVLPLTLEVCPEITLQAPQPPAPPAPRRGAVGWAVYGTVFCISYGVVFSALLIGQLVPGGRLVGEALQDGAASAKRHFGHTPA